MGPWAAFAACPQPVFLSVQAEEGRPAPKAKVSKIIKEAILLFSGHHPFTLYHKTLFTSNIFWL
jgi:hypothetical protein